MANKRKESMKEIEQSVAILDKMFDKESLNDLLYYRAIIKLSFQCIEEGFADKAMILLLKVPRSYYIDHLQADLEDNVEFHEQCLELVKKMKIAGYDVSPLKINMLAAKA